MKPKILIVLSVLILAITARAGVVVIGGSGINVTAASSTNLPTAATVGTFTLTTQVLTQSYNGCTNAGGMIVSGRISLDGTNYISLPFTWTNATAGSTNNAAWTIIQTNFTVYGSITISNSTGQVITNYQAILTN